MKGEHTALHSMPTNDYFMETNRLNLLFIIYLFISVLVLCIYFHTVYFIFEIIFE
jgi:hypothetical protein